MSGSGSEGRNPLVPRPTESSPSSCVPEDRADSELVQQRRARGWIEEPDGRQEAVGRCDHERHALARAGDEQPPAALAADGGAAGYSPSNGGGGESEERRRRGRGSCGREAERREGGEVAAGERERAEG